MCVNFDDPTSTLFIERSFVSNGNPEELYGCGDTLIDHKDGRIFVSNFSKNPVTIPAGQVLGLTRNPSSWLAGENKFVESQRQDAESRTHLIQTLIQEQSLTSKVSIQNNPFVHMGKSQVQQLLNPSRLQHLGEDPLAEPPGRR